MAIHKKWSKEKICSQKHKREYLAGKHTRLLDNWSLVMGQLEALFLACLVRIWLRRTIKKDEQEFFRCTTKYLEQSPWKWSRKQQITLLGRLADRTDKKEPSFIEVECRGKERERWIRIDFDNVEAAIDSNSQGAQKGTLQGVQKGTRKETNNNTNVLLSKERILPADAEQCVNGFFNSKESVPPFDRKYAHLLYKKCMERRKVTPQAKPERWPVELNKWRIKYNVPKSRIKKDLKWYISHFDDEYVPQIYSIDAFTKKIVKLESAMTRTASAHGQKPSEKIELTSDAKEIISQLDNLDWPKGSRDQLPAVIQSSLTIAKRITRILKHETSGFAEYVLGKWHLCKRPAEYLVGYFQEQNERLNNWVKWTGDLHHVALNPKTARSELTDLASGYCFQTEKQTKCVNELMAILFEENGNVGRAKRRVDGAQNSDRDDRQPDCPRKNRVKMG